MSLAKIVSLGAYAPKRLLTNQDLERMVQTSDEWIVRRAGLPGRPLPQQG